MPIWGRPSPVQAWAIDHESIQVTWGWLPHGQLRITTESEMRDVEHPGGPGSVLVGHTHHDVAAGIGIESRSQRHLLPVPNHRPPPGELLSRVATVSDLHLGAWRWGFFKTMREVGQSGDGGAQVDNGRSSREQLLPPVPAPGRAPGPFADDHPVRCARSAIDDAVAWGTDLLVLKGDSAHHETVGCMSQLADLVDGYPSLPMLAIPGNHDVDKGGRLASERLGSRGLAMIRQVEAHDLPGLRLVLADTTIPGRGMGSLDRVGDDVIDAAAQSDRPVMIVMHHQLQPARIARHWPIGIPAPASVEFLDRLDRLPQSIVVTSGHTHRNRVRRHGSVLITEVASTKDWPGVWAGYNVFDGGIEQVLRRVSAPSALQWTEYSRYAVGGLWARWSPGTLSDRCLAQAWSERTHLAF